MENLVKALVKAKSEFRPIRKTKIGVHKAKYAPMDEVLDATEKALFKNGLIVVQPMDGDKLKTIILHESGESLESTFNLVLGGNPQQNGSAITYARRYAYCAMLGVTADEDDDADSTIKGTAYNPSARGRFEESPAEYILPVGQAKGRKLKDVPREQLEGLAEWLEKTASDKGEKLSGPWLVTVNMIEKYLGVD